MSRGKKEKADPESVYEFNSIWAERLALLIIVGLAVEIVAVFILEKPLLEAVLSIASTVLIVAGVWGELIFDRRAKAASDQIVAAAQTRAAEAQEALLRFRTPRVRYLTDANRQRLIEALRPFAGTIFVVGHDNLDREVWDFLWVLEPLISDAGWIHADWMGGERFRKNGWPGGHWYGIANVMNVSVEVRPSPEEPLEATAAARTAALGLVAALTDIGIDADAPMQPNNGSIQTNLVALLVGPKR